MRTTLFLLLVTLSFTACTTYQYVSIDSSQLQKAKDDRLVSENDTMQVIYSFAGPGGDVTITILNKLNEPIYIDWSRSALIRNDQSFTIRRKDLLLIPPQSNVSTVLLNLNEQAGGIPKLRVAHQKAAEYTEANSPIHLKSYLTFLFGPNGSTDRSITHTFYAGESVHSPDRPQMFRRYHAYGNMLYVWYQ